MNKKKKTFFSISLMWGVLLLGSCTYSRYVSLPSANLSRIHIIDNNGFSETISSQDRLKQYDHVDFLHPQPFQKVLRIYKRNECGQIPSVITSYHENGQPKQYLEVMDNRAQGAYREWHSNGVQKVEATIIGGNADLHNSAEKTWLFNGENFVWDEKGNLEAVIRYNKGTLEGDSVYNHPNGALWKKVPYANGEIDGYFEIYLENGELLQKTEYHSGERQGKSMRYWSQEQLAADEEYQEGLLRKGLYFSCSGGLISEIKDGNGFRAVFGENSFAEFHEFRNGLEEGKVQLYDSNQQLACEYFVKNGMKHGEEIEYYPALPKQKKLQPLLTLNWHQGVIQGIAKTWYDNGVLESQREMSNNDKNGLSTAWYRDGSVMLIEEYDSGRLMKGSYFKRGERIPISSVEKGEGLATLYDLDGNFVIKITYKDGVPDENQ